MDAIWVVDERLIKSAHYIPARVTICMTHVSIVLGRDARFIVRV